jgi:hypothetical protein
MSRELEDAWRSAANASPHINGSRKEQLCLHSKSGAVLATIELDSTESIRPIVRHGLTVGCYRETATGAELPLFDDAWRIYAYMPAADPCDWGMIACDGELISYSRSQEPTA